MSNIKKPWSGRFAKDTDPNVERFTESVSFDRRLYRYDIVGSMAHAQTLRDAGYLTQDEFDQIRSGLLLIENQIISGEFVFLQELEDVHMNIEAALEEHIGEAARKLHTARSRNDQVALDMRLWVRDEIEYIDDQVNELQAQLVIKAKTNEEVLLPVYTHTQRAQPVLLPHYLLAYVEKFERDRERLADCMKRVNISPLGACAAAGTTLTVDREKAANILGFTSVTQNSIDAVSDRDFCLEFVFVLSIIAAHLSGLAEEWILWSSQEFGFLKLDEAFTTGSSIMPQKRNPDVLELIRGKTGRVYGDLQALLTIVKGLPLAYNRDMQEDKQATFDAADTVTACLDIAARTVSKASFDADRMAEALQSGFVDATSLAEYLVEKEVPFRSAHEIVGKMVAARSEDNKQLSAMTLDELRAFSDVIDKDVFKCLDAANCVARYRGTGSSSKKEILKRLKHWEGKLRLRPGEKDETTSEPPKKKKKKGRKAKG